MQNALTLLRERRKNGTNLVVVEEPAAKSFITDFLADPSPQSPAKPSLPTELMQFCYLHRMAATGGIPADKAAEVIEAIHDVADMLPVKHKKRLLIEARMEELQELADWLLAWSPMEFEHGEDPFARE